MSEQPLNPVPGENQVAIDDVAPCRKRITITIPADSVASKIDDSLGSLAGETALPGFRKGRAPRRLLERRFGKDVRDEARNQLVADAYSKAVQEHELKPVGEPEPVEPLEDLTLTDGQPLTFSIEVEVVPEFDLPSLEGIEIKRPVMEIGQAQIDAEIARICLQNGSVENVTGPVREGDRVVGHGKVFVEGQDEPIFEHDQVAILCPGKEDGGRGQVLGLLIDGLDKALAGARVGQTIELHTVGPELHEREDVRNAKLTISLLINQADRIEPLAVADLVQKFGLPSEEILAEQVKLALEQRRDVEQAGAMRDQVYDYLIGHVDFKLPEKLSTAHAARTIERMRIELLYRGMTAEEVEDQLARQRAESVVEARNQLKLTFILHKLADSFGIDVSEHEVNGRIASIAARRGLRPEQLRAELTQSGQLSQIAAQIREHKAADRVVHQATVEDLTPEEWEAFLATRSSGTDTDGDQGTGAGSAKSKGAATKGAAKTKKKKKTKKTAAPGKK